MPDCPVVMSGSTLDKRSRGYMAGSTLGKRSRAYDALRSLALASCMAAVAYGCTGPTELPDTHADSVVEPGLPPQVATPIRAPQDVPVRFDDAWFASVDGSLDLHLWQEPGFLESWGAALRKKQHQVGDLPLLLREFQWTPLADAIVNEAARLSTHGIETSRVPAKLTQTLDMLRDRLHELPPLVGFAPDDDPRILAAIHADQALTHLLMVIADLLGAGHSSAPRSPYGAQREVFDVLHVWMNEPMLVQTLGPPMRAYDRLRAALVRYEEIADQGGFLELDSKILSRTRPRRRHWTLAALRKRLAQEDPLVASEGDTWDDELTLALRRARETHQLRSTGPKSKLVDPKLLRALTVPVQARIATLKRNLARWRASEARFYDYTLQVNLPDYHGEFWSGDELLRRFKVVIGSARKVRETGEMPNATPLISSAIRTVIFNPYWNVPERILLEELVPQAKRALTRSADEREELGETVDREQLLSTDSLVEHFNQNGYEVLNQTPSGRLWIRQLPGPANALGKVKFIFPNRHSVFMHDTPSKGKFRFSRRAFSHGCMRVHKPIELARMLLERDGSWSGYRSRKGLRSSDQLVIPLKSPVKLIVDYITNHVDDEDRVHWLHDIYGYDPS